MSRRQSRRQSRDQSDALVTHSLLILVLIYFAGYLWIYSRVGFGS